MTSSSRRSFYKRRRWIAAGVLWLVIAYPVSYGPAEYAVQRGWLTYKSRQAAFLPVIWLLPRYAEDRMTPIAVERTSKVVRWVPVPVPNQWAGWFYRYADSCSELGKKHAASH